MTSGSELDDERLTETLDRYQVDYLLVGGLGAGAYGALRPTTDFDCLAERSTENLDRLAAAMKELGARLGCKVSATKKQPRSLSRSTVRGSGVRRSQPGVPTPVTSMCCATCPPATAPGNDMKTS